MAAPIPRAYTQDNLFEVSRERSVISELTMPACFRSTAIIYPSCAIAHA